MKSMCSPGGNATINSLMKLDTFLLEITTLLREADSGVYSRLPGRHHYSNNYFVEGHELTLSVTEDPDGYPIRLYYTWDVEERCLEYDYDIDSEGCATMVEGTRTDQLVKRGYASKIYGIEYLLTP